MASSDSGGIACVGGASLDRRTVTSGPLQPGTSNPVVSTSRPGGVARNVADGLARLGCPVALFAIVGEDEAGSVIRAGLEEAGVELSGLTHSTRNPTGTYTAVLGPSGRLEFGLADMEIFEEADEAWVESIATRLIERGSWFVDANLPAATLARLLDPKPDGITVWADSVSVAKAVRLAPVLSAIDVLFTNREEAQALSRAPAAVSKEQVIEGVTRIREMGTATVIVTLGSEGTYVADEAGGHARPPIAPRGPLSDVTGAGDALAAGYIFGLREGDPEPLRLGLAAASLVLEAGGSLKKLSPEGVRERAAEAS